MWIVGFILGTILGSFIKATADRSLAGSSLLSRSRCPQCKKRLSWYDLIPLLSYLSLAGKCRYCHKKIGIEYLVVELAMGVLIAFLFWQNFYKIQWTTFLLELVFKIFFITVLVILFLTDLKKMIIPDKIVLPSILITLVFLTGVTLFKIGYLYYSLSQSEIGKLLLSPHNDYFIRHALMVAQPLLESMVMGLLIGGLFYLLIVITRGQGMGGGDVKLGALMGLGLGFPNALIATMIAFLTGAIWSVVLILGGKKHFGQTIAFGPFLVIGSLVALLWADQILNIYLKLGT